MEYIFIIIALVLLLLIYMTFETTLLQKSVIIFSKSSKGLKIAHLSDIHVNHLHISKEKIIGALKKISPDIIIITGDYIESVKNIPKTIDLISDLSEIYPVFLTLGNHDHKALFHDKKKTDLFINQLEAAGAKVLNNSWEIITKYNKNYTLIGIDDLKHGRPDLEKAFFNIAPSKTSGSVNIAFSHNPDMLLSLPKDKVDYFLCGHFHGGQIWMPFHLEFKILRSENLCRMGYRRGLHKINGINTYINRGLGNVLFPFRFFSVPEIAVIQLP
jgi:predicted MPP superfamily phosphohydrolase